MSRKMTNLAEKDEQEIKRAVERGLKEARSFAQKRGVKGNLLYRRLLESEIATVNQRLRVPAHEGK